MKKLDDIINEAVKTALEGLKANIVSEKEEKDKEKKNEGREEEDEDVCKECGGDLVLIDSSHCVCEQCGIGYDIS